VRYVISFNTSFVTTESGREFHVIDTSMPSIYFDSFAIYIKEDNYNLIKMSFGNVGNNRFTNYTNEGVIGLTISNYIDGTDENDEIRYRAENISVLDASNEIVLSTTYDGQRENAPFTTPGSLRFNMQPSFTTPNKTIKVHVGKVLTIGLPVFVVGEVQTVGDYIYKSESKGYWVRKTYIDDQCLNDVDSLDVIYDESTLDVIIKNKINKTTLDSTYFRSFISNSLIVKICSLKGKDYKEYRKKLKEENVYSNMLTDTLPRKIKSILIRISPKIYYKTLGK
jgi:hypothetical protein